MIRENRMIMDSSWKMRRRKWRWWVHGSSIGLGDWLGDVKMGWSGFVDSHIYHANIWRKWKAAMPAHMQ